MSSVQKEHVLTEVTKEPHEHVDSYLSPDALRLWEKTIPFGLLELKKALDTVERWNGDKKLRAVNPAYKETDLEHVIGMLRLKKDIFDRMPHMKNNLDEKSVDTMILLHDIGETITGIDLPTIGGEKEISETLQHKKIEEDAARQLLEKYTDTQLRKELLDIFDEYLENNTLEAKFVRWLDKIQALQVGLKEFYSLQGKNNETNDYLHTNITRLFGQKIMPITINFIKADGVNEEMKRDIATILDTELLAYQKSGYENEILPYRKQLLAYL